MSTIKITDATVEPLDLAAAKAHLRETLVDAGNDGYITSLIKVVRTECENILQRTLLETTWLLSLDAFPAGAIDLPMPPLMSVEFIKYLDTSGVLTTLDPSAYVVIDKVGQVAPLYGTSWPSTRCQPGAVQIQFKAGYGTVAGSVPVPLAWWCRLALEELYRNRGLSGDLPEGFGAGLLDAYRIRSF